MVDVSHNLIDWYRRVRNQSLRICDPLEPEDHQIQPMADASPPKWHLAHTSWFFETFILKTYLPEYEVLDDRYEMLFNSYYNGVGQPFPRHRRGHLSRPTLSEIHQYRQHVDHYMEQLMVREYPQEMVFRLQLGLHHEQQHQELMLTDIKYNFGHNPLLPAYRIVEPASSTTAVPLQFTHVPRGLYEMGRHADTEFCFDNETPRHQVWLEDFEMADRLVTNAEFAEFVADGGYENPDFWLSDAWSMLSAQNADVRWQAPLYWHNGVETYEYRLSGCEPLEPAAPVCHISAYEAAAYARWLSKQTNDVYRLPTEAEWEVSAATESISGNYVESSLLHPAPAESRQFFGDVWEWTSSSYGPYPGYREFAGALGEYNGKFMANQLVLRGGSCATPQSHMRLTYRNFFYPPDRWQFTGIRLVREPVS